MYLFELFGEESDYLAEFYPGPMADAGQDGEMIETIRGQIMDYLTPLAASEVEWIPIQDIADTLRSVGTGLVIDRGLIMRLIDPNVCKLVKEIQGDKVYLAVPVDDMAAQTEEDEEKDREKVAKTGEQQAKKAVQQK